MVLWIPNTNIRVYEQPRGYRATWYSPKAGQSAKRVWGTSAKSIAAALGSLFGKIELPNAERDAAWSKAKSIAVDKSDISHTKPAISHKKQVNKRAGTGTGRPLYSSRSTYSMGNCGFMD